MGAKMSESHEPIDAVITWVDGADPQLRAKRFKYLNIDNSDPTISESRFSDCDELYYCLIGIARNLPFIRRVFIVTDNQIPPAIERLRNNSREFSNLVISIVDHKEVFRDFEQILPTFNSTTIETALHRIPNLSDRYIYFNDDFIAIKPLDESFFFRGNQPVLRGYMRNANLVRSLRGRLLQRGKGNYFSYKDYQLRSAEIFGETNKYFWHDHIPHPFFRPIVAQFFEHHQDLFRRNISFRSRNYIQFDTMALSNNLQIRNGNKNILRARHLLYVKPSDKRFTRIYLLRKWIILNIIRKKFLCIQALSDCSPSVRNAILHWLDKKLQ
jgi:hypothetical protein